MRDLGQTATSAFRPPSVAAESPAAAPFGWPDLNDPFGQLAPKVAFRFGRSFPTLAGGVAGGVAGTAVGPEGTVAGALIGGTLGAAALSAAQTLGPAYAAELQKTPNDPEGAWQRAWAQAAISGAFSGAWDDYRDDGRSFGKWPTNAEYGEASQRALVASGFTRAQASQLADQAAAERAANGLNEAEPVPRIPIRIDRYKR